MAPHSLNSESSVSWFVNEVVNAKTMICRLYVVCTLRFWIKHSFSESHLFTFDFGESRVYKKLQALKLDFKIKYLDELFFSSTWLPWARMSAIWTHLEPRVEVCRKVQTPIFLVQILLLLHKALRFLDQTLELLKRESWFDFTKENSVLLAILYLDVFSHKLISTRLIKYKTMCDR